MDYEKLYYKALEKLQVMQNNVELMARLNPSRHLDEIHSLGLDWAYAAYSDYHDVSACIDEMEEEIPDLNQTWTCKLMEELDDYR